MWEEKSGGGEEHRTVKKNQALKEGELVRETAVMSGL